MITRRVRMMVSAINIDGLEKMEQMEHFFNDVKYATISLNKDMQQINEQYRYEILQLDVASMKKRLQEEYSIWMKPTYECLQLEGFPFNDRDLKQYILTNQEILEQGISSLSRMVELIQDLSQMGLEALNSLGRMKQVIQSLKTLNLEMYPTIFWLDANKYDFIKQLIEETKERVDGWLQTSKQISEHWSNDVLEPSFQESLTYYMERKTTGLKLFDLNFHKCKKLIRDQYIKEQGAFQESEIEQLHATIELRKKHETWFEEHYVSIKQYLGEGYEETNTDYLTLTSQYEFIHQLSQLCIREGNVSKFAATIMSEQGLALFKNHLLELKSVYDQLPMEQLCLILPKLLVEYDAIPVAGLKETIQTFYQVLLDLRTDYETLCSYRHATYAKEPLAIEDIRTIVYRLERVVQKQTWLQAHQKQIKQVFRNQEVTLDTDWNALRDRLFHTDVIEHFNTYQSAQELLEAASQTKPDTMVDVIRFILQCEAPIKDEVLYKRVIQLWDEVNRMTPKLKEQIQELITTELASEYVWKEAFIYKLDGEVKTLRLPNDKTQKREIDYVAPVELKAGILTLLHVNYEMPLDEISKEIARLLGYPRRSKKFNDIVAQAVMELQRDQKITRYSRGFRIKAY